MKRYLCSLVALGLLVGVTGQAMAQPSYSFTLLDVPGSSKASAVALGINAPGQIVGSYYDAAYLHHGFLLDQGGYTTLDVPGSIWTYASGINASGQIMGSYYLDSATFLAGDHGSYRETGTYALQWTIKERRTLSVRRRFPEISVAPCVFSYETAVPGHCDAGSNAV